MQIIDGTLYSSIVFWHSSIVLSFFFSFFSTEGGINPITKIEVIVDGGAELRQVTVGDVDSPKNQTVKQNTIPIIVHEIIREVGDGWKIGPYLRDQKLYKKNCLNVR